MIGTTLGPYQVVAKLGAGGMGEVYKARDTRLDRSVAIKVLAGDVAADPTLRGRFEREARAVAALDHPHICAIYDVGEADGRHYLVMPCLEGQTLAARLEKGALPVMEALAVASEIADALDKAHRHGIVHRDLKPGNIMLTKSGSKLLDFGLAKLRPPGGPISMSGMVQLATTSPGTAHGIILGTVQYMSPEQVEGREVDARTDIWALGAVLYEMVTGARPFSGDTPASVIGSILKDSASPVSARVPLAPRALDHVIASCLAKDPDERWQSAADVRQEIEWIARSPSDSMASPAATNVRRGPRIAWALAALAIAALTADNLRLRWPRTTEPAEPVVFTVQPPPGRRFAGPGASVQTPQLAVSPDGRQLAFIAAEPDGRLLLWIRSFDNPNLRSLNGTEDAADPFWSPDSRSVAFFARGVLKRVDLFGSAPPEVIAKATVDPRGGAWSATGGILFAGTLGGRLAYLPRDRVGQVGSDAASATRIDLAGPPTQRWPDFLPDGQHFLFGVRDAEIERRGVYLGRIGSSTTQQLLRTDWNARYALGHVLFLNDSTLMAQPLDIEGGRLTGQPVTIAQNVGAGSNSYGAFSVSAGSVLAYAPGLVSPSELVWMDREGARLTTAQPVGDYIDFRLSPDETRLAFSRAGPQSQASDIWILDFARNTVSRLTSEPLTDAAPLWSPQGDQIIFRSNRAGPTLELFRTTPNPGGPVELVYGGSQLATSFSGSATMETALSTDWSSDGRFVIFHSSSAAASYDISALSLDAGRKRIPVASGPYNELQGVFSPDPRWIAFASDESGRYEIYVQDFPAATRRVIVSTNGGTQPQWRKDGQELFYLQADGTLMTAAVRTNAQLDIAAPKPLFKTAIATSVNPYRMDYVPSGDGKRFLMRIPSAGATQPVITVVLNWPALLRK